MNPTIQRDSTQKPISLPLPAGQTEKVVPESSHDDLPENMPPVFQFPVVATVQARFYKAGRHEPLPFPESDD
jgi:hypothetical protein